MTTTVSPPGIGPLALERGPGSLTAWRLRQPVISAAYRDPIAVTVLLDGTDDLDHVDLPLIADVIGDIDRYLTAGLRFVHTTMLADPAWFGLAEEDLGSYRDLRAEDLPLGGPQLTFYADNEWLLHFEEGRLPICGPYGLAVVFEERQPVRMEDLSDAELVD